MPNYDHGAVTYKELEKLADRFPPEDLEWRLGGGKAKKIEGKMMAPVLAYVTARAIHDRLDDVCGVGGWTNHFEPGPDGGVMCTISIRVMHPDGTIEWVSKKDGAANTKVEAVKGGYSSSLKRAAVEWGIGRYLYKLPKQMVTTDPSGKYVRGKPKLPVEFLPEGYEPPKRAAKPEGDTPAARRSGPKQGSMNPAKQRTRKAPVDPVVDGAFFYGTIMPTAQALGYSEEEIRSMIEKDLGFKPRQQQTADWLAGLTDQHGDEDVTDAFDDDDE